MKNRTVIGVICIVLAIAIAFGLAPFVNNLSSNTMTVCQVADTVSKGDVITTEDIIEVEVGSFGVASGVVQSADDLIGLYASSDLYCNTNLYPEMFTQTLDSSESVFDSLDATKVAMSVTIQSLASGLSGNLQNGDIVSVVVVSGVDSLIPVDLTYLQIITTTTSAGINQDGTVADEELPATVTLLITPEQAELLANYEANAKLHLVLVTRDADKAAELLQLQEELTAQVVEEEAIDQEAEFLAQLEAAQNSEVTADE